jgi:hypothetical protein
MTSARSLLSTLAGLVLATVCLAHEAPHAEPTDEVQPAAVDNAPAVAQALTARVGARPPIQAGELTSWGRADVDGDRNEERLVSWTRDGAGGVALVSGPVDAPAIAAYADVGEPVIRVEPVPLAGDATRHLLVRSGARAKGVFTGRVRVLASQPDGLKPIWEIREINQIEENPDLTSVREACLVDVAFEQGEAGQTGGLMVYVMRFSASPGQAAARSAYLGQDVMELQYDPASKGLRDRRGPAIASTISKTLDRLMKAPALTPAGMGDRIKAAAGGPIR